jgi:hypothetical protein
VAEDVFILKQGESFYEFLGNVLNEEFRIGMDKQEVKKYN